MKRSRLPIALSSVFFLIFLNCSVRDEVNDSIQRVECVQLLADFTDLESENRTCAQIISDIDKIERDCNEFLNEDTKTFLANARANCTDN